MEYFFIKEFTNIRVISANEIINNNTKVHKREANPGQFKKYLKQETIKILNNEY